MALHQPNMENKLAANFWQRNLQGKSDAELGSSWADEVAFLYQSGISMEDATQYLFHERPALPDFMDWVQQKTVSSATAVESATVFSAEELQFFEREGYIVLKNAIPKAAALAAQNAIWEFLGMSEGNPDSWYAGHPAQKGMMVQFSDHPALNKNRESARIRKAYEQLYGSTAIYKTIDKVSFNPPVTPNYNFTGSGLHWDVSLRLPIPFRLQGLIYLSDCGEKDGAFHCVPGFQLQIQDWMDNLPKGSQPRTVAAETLKAVPITAAAGDMVIWSQALPHCATPNHGKLPRMVQYLSYFPTAYQDASEWI